jgi:hypothetical protein
MRPAASARVPVVYVGGCQRSGSTVLDRIVGQGDGFHSVGEIVHLWQRGVHDDELCGCGESFRSCPFWERVGADLFGGWDRAPIDEVLALQRRVDRNRYIPLMLAPWISPRYRRDLEAYADLLGRLYRAIHRAAGGGVVVDSSKHASTSFVLRHVADVRVRVLHLVRDSRGVAASLLKSVRRPDSGARTSFMHRSSVGRSASEWLAFNLLFHLGKATGMPTTVVRYEDLVAAPDRVVQRVAPDGEAWHAALRGSTISLGIDHTVSGNPIRFATGDLELRLDDAWRRSLPRVARIATTAMTWPLLVAYGYRLGGP